jgi:hypothetical protein
MKIFAAVTDTICGLHGPSPDTDHGLAFMGKGIPVSRSIAGCHDAAATQVIENERGLGVFGLPR